MIEWKKSFIGLWTWEKYAVGKLISEGLWQVRYKDKTIGYCKYEDQGKQIAERHAKNKGII